MQPAAALSAIECGAYYPCSVANAQPLILIQQKQQKC